MEGQDWPVAEFAEGAKNSVHMRRLVLRSRLMLWLGRCDEEGRRARSTLSSLQMNRMVVHAEEARRLEEGLRNRAQLELERIAGQHWF